MELKDGVFVAEVEDNSTSSDGPGRLVQTMPMPVFGISGGRGLCNRCKGRLPTSIPANGLLPIPTRLISPSTAASNTQFVAVTGPPVLPLTFRALNEGAI